MIRFRFQDDLLAFKLKFRISLWIVITISMLIE
jgi:hypothetical protein